MNLFDPVLLVVIFFGIITSYTDIKNGKIKNIHIILLVFSGIFINIFFTKVFLNFSFNINSDFIQSITNILIAFLFGFFIWSSGLWPSGDAKLFLGYSFLLPVFTYKYGYVSFFPSLVILINTIMPLAFFLIFTSLLQINLKQFKEYIIKNFKISYLVNIILFIFGFSFILRLILFLFGIQLNFIFQTFVLFAFMEILNKISSRCVTAFSLVGIALRIVLFFSSIFTFSFFWEILSMLLIFVGLRLFIFYIIEFSFVETVKIENLKPGLLLAERLVKTKKGYEKKSYSIFTFFDVLRDVKEGFLSETYTTLTKEDIERLKKNKKLKFDSIRIAKTIPLAPFMFFGVLLTYILQGSLFYYLTLTVEFISKFI